MRYACAAPIAGTSHRMEPPKAISPTRSENYPEWYQQVVKAADLAEPSDVRGCMVIKPWGFAIWENIQRRLDLKSPLQGSSQDDIVREVDSSLASSHDGLLVFIEDLVKLAELEIEVANQRERIRLLLGGDRRLSGLGNNEVIMTAELEELWKAVD